MNGGFIDEVVKRRDGVIAKERHDLHDPILLHLNLILANEGIRLDELAAKPLLDRVD